VKPAAKKPARKSVCAMAYEILDAEARKARRAPKEDLPALLKPPPAKKAKR
jgi:hypothetical protein